MLTERAYIRMIKDQKEKTGFSWAKIASLSGMSKSCLSKYVAGNYQNGLQYETMFYLFKFIDIKVMHFDVFQRICKRKIAQTYKKKGLDEDMAFDLGIPLTSLKRIVREDSNPCFNHVRSLANNLSIKVLKERKK